MIPTKDLYADKDGNLTDDPAKYAIQVAVAGVELDDRAAKRYGIEDSLVSVDEPRAVRQVRSAAKSEEPESETEADEADETDESKASVQVKKAEARKPTAKKGAKKK